MSEKGFTSIDVEDWRCSEEWLSVVGRCEEGGSRWRSVPGDSR